MTRSKNITPLVRFEAQYIPEPNSGCWLWTGSGNQYGYGRFLVDGQRTLAHRFAYEVFKGPLIEGFELDHVCRVRCCVNPDHLEQVTHAENARRVAQTHCRRGHPHTEENSLFMSTTGNRQCRTCNNLRYRQRIERENA